MSAPLLAAWKDRAACRDTYIPRDADPFYPEGNVSGSYYNDAKRICGGCPVRDACLEDVIGRKDSHGFRAGFTPEQLRERIKSRPQPAASPARADSVTEFVSASAGRSTKTGAANRARVTELALAGLSGVEIAKETGLSVATAMHHLKDLRDRGAIPIDAGWTVRDVPECGTYTAYRKHRREQNQPCRPCTDAMNKYERERRAAKRAAIS